MSEASAFLDSVYRLSQLRKYAELEEYISNTFDFMHHAGKHEQIDGVLYNLDLSKISAKIARTILYNVNHYADKLIMVKDFNSRAIDEFGKDSLS